MARKFNEQITAQGGLVLPGLTSSGQLGTDSTGKIIDQSIWTPAIYLPWWIPAATTTATRIMYPGNAIAINTTASAYGVFYLDPTHYTAAGQSVNVRLAVNYETNGTAIGCNFTVGLYPVATWLNATREGVATVGTALTSYTVTTPAANSQGHGVSTATALTANYYVIGVVTTATTAASSDVEGAVVVQLQTT